jgi:hypothetical protein
MQGIARALLITLVSGAAMAHAQSQTRIYPRDLLEKNWPEARKAGAITFLNECRKSADKFLEIWRTESDAAIFASVHSPQPFSRADFDKVMAQLRFFFGDVVTTEYRNAILVLNPGDTLESLQSPMVQTEYTTTTTKWSKTADLFFQVNLRRAGGSCEVAGFRIHKYLTDDPIYLQQPTNDKDDS